jgi:hypothetical protein
MRTKSIGTTIENASIAVAFDAHLGTFAVTDRSSQRTWRQVRLPRMPTVVNVTRHGNGRVLLVELRGPRSRRRFRARITVPARGAEVRCLIEGEGPMSGPLSYPAPFAAEPGSFLVIPTNEGHLYPQDEAALGRLVMRGLHGHNGLSMPWYGQCVGETGPSIMTVIETHADLNVIVDRPGGPASELAAWVAWDPSFGEFSYPRSVTFVVIPSGGYVAQAKRYREEAKKKGLYKSLREKQEENRWVDRLIGAANIWAWRWPGEMGKVALAEELQSLGIKRILWSGGGTADEIKALNRHRNVLTSRFCSYQDTYPPDEPERARHWGWPDAVAIDADGTPQRGWTIRGRAGRLYPGAVICSKPGLELVREAVDRDLATTPYRCRFVDTTCASPMVECHNPDHPQTRADDLESKMRILRFCSEEKGLVTGTESGIDDSVPYVHYYEGMLSLSRYWLPDAGYEMLAYKTPTPDFLKFQVGPYYRVPLWELVYHDCTVSHWYWGDSSNKAPEVWDKKDLINILYATPPMYFLSPEVWEKYKARCAGSYSRVAPIARRFGYDEMISHGFLTRDHTFQRTDWSSGASIVVNFADYPQETPEGSTVPAGGSVVVKE